MLILNLEQFFGVSSSIVLTSEAQKSLFGSSSKKYTMMSSELNKNINRYNFHAIVLVAIKKIFKLIVLKFV